MNAYELAKQLEERHAPYEDDAANMLRQQADRIAELEKQLQKQVREPVETKTIYKITPEMIGAALGLKPRRRKKNDCNNS